MIVENSGQFWIEKDKLTYLHGYFFWCRSKLQPEIVYESTMEWGLKSVPFLGKTGSQCSLYAFVLLDVLSLIRRAPLRVSALLRKDASCFTAN